MFAKLSLLAAVLPLVHAAITINAPTDAVSATPGTITFSGDGSDPIFTVELNHPSLLNAIAIANNVNPGDGSANIIWPRLLETTGYTLTAVNVSNINDVFATSGAFNIAPPPSTSGSSSLPLTSGTATNPPSASVTSPAGSSTSGSSRSSSGSQSATQSSPNSSSSSAAPTQINGNGAFSIKSNVGAVALAAAVGAAVFAL